LETETFRSLEASVGRVPPPLSRGGPDSAWLEVVDQSAKAVFPSKESSLGPVSLSSVSKSFDNLDIFSSTAQSKIQPRPILDCPLYYEPNSSFFAKKSPSAIFDAITKQLKKRKIIYDFVQLKNKIKGVMYSTDDSAPCTFRINLFKAPNNVKKAKFLVEIQRRYGCVVVFRRFYQQFLQALVSEGIAIPFSALTPAADLQPSQVSQVSLDKTTLDILLRSIGNPSKLSTANLENLRETLRVLASLSRTSQNKAVLVSAETDRSNLFEVLLSVLKLPDGEVRRCGATLLNNLAALESIRGELLTKLASCMFQMLDTTSDDLVVAGFMSGSLIEREIQRQIAQALAMLTETHASDLVRQSNYSYFLEILNKHKTSSDELLKDSVRVTIANLS